LTDATMTRARTHLACTLLALMLPAAPAGARTNDPLFSQLWGLQDIGAEQAWKVARGSGVLIAVVDTGVDLDHPDLKNKILPGINLVNSGPPMDDHGHGTLIAGVAGAETGNSEGIASVAPDASILPVRVFDAEGSATSSRVVKAIRWAVDEAARRKSKLVLNLSFVGEAPAQGQTGLLGVQAVRRSIESAAAQGAVVVTASGNEGQPQTAFDAESHQGIIVVGAYDRQDRCAKFTNYGAGLDILAPGTGILSTYYNKAEHRSGYAYGDGTSLAVPFVSGAAALLLSTGLDNIQTVDRLISTARGPGVTCGTGDLRYKLLDVAAALGVRRIGRTPDQDLSPLPTPIPSALIMPAFDNDPVETPGPAKSPTPGIQAAPGKGGPSPLDPVILTAIGLVFTMGWTNVVLLYRRRRRRLNPDPPEPLDE
jgi:serine protease